MEPGFYRGVVEGMGCGVMTIDTAGRILTLNELGRQILELTASAEGRPCAEVLEQHPRLTEILLGSLGCETLPSRAELERRVTALPATFDPEDGLLQLLAACPTPHSQRFARNVRARQLHPTAVVAIPTVTTD